MSVILDALRRVRRPGSARPPGAPPGVPAALRPAQGSRRRQSSPGGSRWVLVLFVVAAGIVIWAGAQFGPLLLRRSAPAPLETRPVAGPAPAAVQETEPPTAADGPGEPVSGPASVAEVVERITEPAAVASRTTQNAPDRAAAEPAPREPARPAPPAGAAAPRAAGAASRPPLDADAAPAVSPAAPAPPVPAVNHFELAVRYHSLGNFAQALTHYNAVIEADEFNVEARNNLGLLYHERGLAGEAVEQFRRAILIDPAYLTARGNLAVALMSAGRLAEARAELRAALAIAPRNADLLVNMALVEKADQHPGQAIQILQQALGENPRHAAAHYNLGVLYDEAGERGRAYDHYTDFLAHAGPEHGQRLSDVRRRVEVLAPALTPRP